MASDVSLGTTGTQKRWSWNSLKAAMLGYIHGSVYLVDATGHNVSQLDGLHYCKIYRTTTGEEAKINEMVSKTKITRLFAEECNYNMQFP